MNVVNKIYPRSTIKRINKKIKLLGDKKISLALFLNTRLFIIILGSVLLLIYTKFGYILAPIFAILFYGLFEKVVLDMPIEKRTKKLEKEALFFFEVFALTLEGGRSLKHALDLTVENIDSEIAEEFRKALTEVKLGKSLTESLNMMKTRIPSENINNALLNMIESNAFGNSIQESMYNQIDYLREKQLLDIKAHIAKLPTKVSIISVLFFVPIMMLIILAPVIISYITS